MKRTFMKTLKGLLLVMGVCIMASCTGEEPVDNGNGNGNGNEIENGNGNNNGSENGDDNGNGNENTEPNTEFSVEVAVLDYDNMTIKVTPPDDAPVYYALLYPDTENSLGLDDDALLESILTNTNYENFIFEGEQNLKYAGLVGHSHYRLVYFSYDNEFDLPFGLLYRSERITTPDGPKKFNIEVSDVTGMDANLKIVPEDPNMTYTYYVESMDNFQNTRNGSDYEQIRYDYNYWKFCADTYSQPIEEIIGSSLATGTLDQNSYEFYGGLLEWDCEYMAYAYGVDTKGNMLTHMTKEVFKTKAPKTSDTTFEVTEVRAEYYYEQNPGYGALQGFKLEADIVPSNPDEKYFVTITNNDWYAWYYGPNNNGRSDTKYVQQQILQNANKSAQELTKIYKQGNISYNAYDDRGTLAKANKEYVVLIFGMDENGATTEITSYKFKTGSFPKE